jgi:protein-S-isoprenylcysteine O-methyltransferase Ste14
VTNGIYGWLKHPAYLSKNASWWLLSIPSLSTASTSNAIRLCLMLLCLNAIYYLRAKTEERHLSWDPVYRDYAKWMRQKDFGAQLKNAGQAMIGLLGHRLASK